jgi:F-type H+-transporting ATPase subunit delta
LTVRGSSRASFAAARNRLDELTRDSTVELDRVGDEMFAVLAVLDHEPALRRSLSDPARSGDDKAMLVRSLFGQQLSPTTADLLEVVAGGRWASGADLTDAVERLAVEAVVAAAEREGRLDDVEDELFRFVRIVDGTPPLRQALSDRAAPRESKEELVDGLLGGRAAPESQRLVRQCAVAPRGRTIESVLSEYGQIAADRRSRLVAHVKSAVPLTDEERARLGRALRRIYGRDVHLDIDVDPEVVGGMEVMIAGEIVDGTMASRLAEARRQLAS